MTTIATTLQNIKHTLSNHPTIVNFRWTPTQSYTSTWNFLFTSIFLYVLSAIILHSLFSLLHRYYDSKLRIPLGPLPAIHSLLTAVASAVIFLGTLLSAVEEIDETRWLWHRTKATTPIHWLLCFPLGTRPSGRVFFWSYAYYLSRFLHLARTFFTIIEHKKLTFFTLFNQSILLCTSFLWLEFSQSFQVLAILLTTSLYAVVYGYRFWTNIGLPGARFPFVVNCQVVVAGCNMVCHLGVLVFHLLKGGCNGIGAWGFNSVLNGLILLLLVKFYVQKMHFFNHHKKDN